MKQNPPYRVVSCSYSLPRASRPVCAALACNPLPPGKCSDGANQQSTGNQVCSWNLSKNCTSLTPIQPGSTWEFGYMTDVLGPIHVGIRGKGWVPALSYGKPLPSGPLWPRNCSVTVVPLGMEL